MRASLKHLASYLDDELFSDGRRFHASRTRADAINQGSQPYVHNNRTYTWLHGELYNREQLEPRYKVAASTDAEFLANVYALTQSFQCLREIDGSYVAVVYDSERNRVHLISDRDGFKPLYWAVLSDDLVWASELKGFLSWPGFRPVINRQAVHDFFAQGYLLGDASWFEHVQLLTPASVLTFDMETGHLDQQCYWSWHDIPRLPDSVDEEEVAQEAARLFRSAVLTCLGKGERVGLTLSGGLDSRAILAAIPDGRSQLHSFTFGQRGCQDLWIAQRLSAMKGTAHHVFELNAGNWLAPRVSAVWRSDGSHSLLDMHGVGFFADVKKEVDFILNGEVRLLRGVYLDMIPPCDEVEGLLNRSIRFTNQAAVLEEASGLIRRKPFEIKELADFSFSIPECLRKDGRLYTKMLLLAFPSYFKNIPRQGLSTCPIGYPRRVQQFSRVISRNLDHLRFKMQRVGVPYSNLWHHTNYPRWLNEDPAEPFVTKLLLSKKALYREYVDSQTVRSRVVGHGAVKTSFHEGLLSAQDICRTLTFELWLQQVYERKYREYEG